MKKFKSKASVPCGDAQPLASPLTPAFDGQSIENSRCSSLAVVSEISIKKYRMRGLIKYIYSAKLTYCRALPGAAAHFYADADGLITRWRVYTSTYRRHSLSV